MPQRYQTLGDPHASINGTAGSLQSLLDLAARDETQGLGDAPWPPHFAKQEGEGKRVQPSKAKKEDEAGKSFTSQLEEGFGNKRFRKRAAAASTPAEEESATEAAPKKPRAPRKPTQPLLIIAQSPDKSAAEAGLQRWRDAHPEASALLAPDDILTDRMRGASTIWYRIRVNLRNVPEDQRPVQQTPDPDDDPTRAWKQLAAE